MFGTIQRLWCLLFIASSQLYLSVFKGALKTKLQTNRILSHEAQVISMDYFAQRLDFFSSPCCRKLLYLCLLQHNCRLFTCYIMKSGLEKKKSQTFFQSDKTMIHHVSWLQKYVIRFNLS